MEKLVDIVSTICEFSNDSLLLCGDLNCPGVDSSSVDDGLAAVLDSLDLELLVDKPTRENNLPDIVATYAPRAFSAIHVDDASCLFDHRLIGVRLVFTGAVKSTYRNIRKIDLPSFEKTLRESPLFVSPAKTADAFAAQIADVVSAELDKVASFRKCKRCSPKAIMKWLSSEAIRFKRERRRLEKSWIGSQCESDRDAYRQRCHRTNRLINNSRRDYDKDKLKSCNHSGLQWKVARDLLHNSNKVARIYCTTSTATLPKLMRKIKLSVVPFQLFSTPKYSP